MVGGGRTGVVSSTSPFSCTLSNCLTTGRERERGERERERKRRVTPGRHIFQVQNRPLRWISSHIPASFLASVRTIAGTPRLCQKGGGERERKKEVLLTIKKRISFETVSCSGRATCLRRRIGCQRCRLRSLRVSCAFCVGGSDLSLSGDMPYTRCGSHRYRLARLPHTPA